MSDRASIDVAHPSEIPVNIRFQYSDDPKYVCFAMLSGPDGKFTNFAFDVDLAHTVMMELLYHTKRHNDRIRPYAPKS